MIKRLDQNGYIDLNTGSCVTKIGGIWFKISKADPTPREIKTVKEFMNQ